MYYRIIKTYLLDPTEDQEKMLQAFLENNQISFFVKDEELLQHVLNGIKREQENIVAGRTLGFDELKRRFPAFE